MLEDEDDPFGGAPDTQAAVLELAHLRAKRDAERSRTTITVRQGDGHNIVKQVLPALAKSAHVYRRSQRLVNIVDWVAPEKIKANDITRDPGVPVINELSTGALWVLMSEHIKWLRYDARSEKEVQCDPPGKVITAVHDLGDWPSVPRLRGVVTIPILRGDGSLCSSPGYDEGSGLYYAPTCEIPAVPASPTKEDAARAVGELLEVIEDVPFVEPSHRAAWVATVLSRVAWGAFDGGAPMTVFDASGPGVGKTLAADMSALISTGAMAAHSPYVEDDDEMRKRVTSHLMAGDQVVLIDNVPSGATVGWASLDNALTSGVWQDRELGTNSVARLTMDALWMVTGNNLNIGADARRRTLLCRIECDEEHPEERQDFKHANLPAWVLQERPRLLAAAFTILRAYIAAGKPGVALVPMGSFEGWSGLVRSALFWCGQPDPCAAKASLVEGADQEADAHVALMAGWGVLLDSGGRGLTAGQILGQIKADQETFAGMAEAFATLCDLQGATLPTSQGAGCALRKLRGRVRTVNGKRMRLACKKHGNSTTWRVESLESLEARTPYARDLSDSLPVGGLAASKLSNVSTPEAQKPSPAPCADDDDDDEEAPF